jgi:hypothetical protein
MWLLQEITVMDVIEKYDRSFPDAGKQFESWRFEHDTDGWFANLSSATSALLHRANCPHFDGSMTPEQMVKTPKWCSTNRTALKLAVRATQRSIRDCECI